METLLTIVIPIYKTEKFIERCITSVCEQTLENFEIILVNDASPDNAMDIAVEILKNYPNRYEQTLFVSLDTNQGLPNARKIALEKAKGKYIASLDSDDYMEKDALKLMLDKIQADNADILVCDYFFSSKKKDFYIKQECSESPLEFIAKLFTAELQGFWWNKLYSKKLLDDIQIFTDIHMQEDVLVAFQSGLAARKISYLPKACVHYVQYNTNSMTKNYTKKSISDLLFVMEWMENELKKNNEKYIVLSDDLIYRKYLMKSDIITYSEKPERYSYFSLYDQEILTQSLKSKLTLYKKLFMWLVNKRFYSAIDFILYIRKIKWYVFHKLH